MCNLFKLLPVLLIIISVSFFYQSCSKDGSTPGQILTTEVRASDGNFETQSDWEVRFITNNPYRNQLAEVISIACCRKPELKEAIKQSVSDFKSSFRTDEDEMFFNVQKSKPNSILRGKSIAQELIDLVPEKPVNRILDFLCNNDPGLAILLEGNLNSSTISNDVYIDENFDDSNLENSIYLYSCGNRNQQTLRFAEYNQNMILIVRESEAYNPEVSASGLVETKSLGVYCNNDITIIGNSLNGPDSEPNSGGNTEIRVNPCPSEWRSIQNGKENIYRYKTRNDYDPCRGSGEFLEYALYGKDLKYKFNDVTGKLEITGYVTDHVEKRQNEVKDNFNWKVVNADLFRWYPDANGYRYKIVWYEDDGGKYKPLLEKVTLVAKIKLPDGTTAEGSVIADINDSGGLIQFFTDGDDFIGENIVDWCDPENFDYTPSSLDQMVFHINER